MRAEESRKKFFIPDQLRTWAEVQPWADRPATIPADAKVVKAL
jgi:hypothetical protein